MRGRRPVIPSPDTGLLGRSSILRRLDSGQIFAPGTWNASQVRGAGYDIRMASDLLFMTDSKGAPHKYGLGNHHTGPVILEPSCVALVSSHERFRLPEDLGASVSLKWSLARDGILVLTGGFVNPGFGYRKVDGRLVAVPDERLHFLIVNLSDESYVLTPHTTEAVSLQFFTIIGSAEHVIAESSQEQVAAESPDAPNRALSLFPQLTAQRQLLEELQERVNRVENGTQPLVTFGIYLVSITFLGVILNGALSLVSDARVSKLAHAIPSNVSFTIIAVTFLLFLTVVSRKLLELLVELVRAL